MPKCVKMLSSKWHRKQEHFFIHSLKITMHSVCQETIFFCRKQLGNGGDVILDYVPLWAPGNLTGPNWHTSHLDNVSNKIRLQLSL